MSGPADTERLIILRRRLAWTLPVISTLLTLIFFTLMASGSPWIGRAALGRFGSVAILAALCILALIATFVWLYGWISNAIERRTGSAEAPR